MALAAPSRSAWHRAKRTNCPTPFRSSTCCQAFPNGSSATEATRAYRFRDHIWSIGSRPAIPHQRHEAPVACPEWIYNNRNRVERLWARLKEWRAVATRYEKTAVSFAGVLFLAAALDWLK